MLEQMIDSLLAFLVMVFRYEVGTVEFYIAASCAAVGLLVVARLLAGLFGSSKGVFTAMGAVGLPLVLGAVGYVAVELHALPQIQAAWATSYLPWSVFGVVAVLVGLFASSKLWDIGRSVAVVVLVFAGFGGLAAQYVGELVIDVLDSGTQQVEKRDDRLIDEIENAN